MIEQMRTKARVEPASSRKGTIGEFPAFVVSYLDRSGRAPTYLHFAWVAMGEKTYQLIGLAPEKHRESLKNAALSLRPLTEVERGAVTGKRLRIVAARQDGGHACAHAVFDDGRDPQADARNVGDRVPLTRLSGEREAQIPRSGFHRGCPASGGGGKGVGSSNRRRTLAVSRAISLS